MTFTRGDLSTWIAGLLAALLPPLIEAVRSVDGSNDFNPSALLLSLLPLLVSALVYVQKQVPQATWTDAPLAPLPAPRKRTPRKGAN